MTESLSGHRPHVSCPPSSGMALGRSAMNGGGARPASPGFQRNGGPEKSQPIGYWVSNVSTWMNNHPSTETMNQASHNPISSVRHPPIRPAVVLHHDDGNYQPFGEVLVHRGHSRSTAPPRFQVKSRRSYISAATHSSRSTIESSCQRSCSGVSVVPFRDFQTRRALTTRAMSRSRQTRTEPQGCRKPPEARPPPASC